MFEDSVYRFSTGVLFTSRTLGKAYIKHELTLASCKDYTYIVVTSQEIRGKVLRYPAPMDKIKQALIKSPVWIALDKYCKLPIREEKQ